VTADSNNDVAMLHAAVAAGGVGMAVGNAAKETIASATYILPNQWDDGAAIGLNFTRNHLR